MSYNILVVDDEELIRDLLKRILENDGYTVIAVSSADDALESLKQNDISLIFSDIFMQGKSGMELLKIVKKEYPYIPIIMMTGYASIETVIESLKMGAENYILKPFENIEISNTVKSILSNIDSRVYTYLQEIFLLLVPIAEKYVNGKLKEQDYLNEILNVLLKSKDADSGSIMLYNDVKKELEIVAQKGLNASAGTIIPLNGSVASYIVKTQKPIMINGKASLLEQFTFVKDRDDIKMSMVLPLKVGEKIIGIANMNISKANTRKFSKIDEKLLETFSTYVSFAISNYLAAKKLMEYNQLKSEFISCISHELRTPIMSISGARELLESRLPKDASSKKMHEIIKRNLERMMKLIQDLLDFSRTEISGCKLKKTTVDITGLVRDVIDAQDVLAKNKNITIQKEIEDGISLFCDEERIKQAFSNILSNAIKFTLDGGRITVSVRGQRIEVRGQGLVAGELPFAKFRGIAIPPLHNSQTPELSNSVVISVADSGIGIDSKEHKKIFEKFYRISNNVTEKGFGIGLATAKTYIEAHGGKICVESAGAGKGSKFTIILPRQKLHDDCQY